jgi:formylglycine-generating enzyme required for sulfatase activity
MRDTGGIGVALAAVSCGTPVLRTTSVSSFQLDRTEITVSNFESCVTAGACTPPKRSGTVADYSACNWGQPDKSRHPVNCVTHDQAVAFCAWQKKRLPTEPEWLLAALGKGDPNGDRRNWPWSDLTFGDHHGAVCIGHPGTCEIATSSGDVTELGILDMAGNVAEWTSSKRNDYHDFLTTGPDDGYVVAGYRFDNANNDERLMSLTDSIFAVGPGEVFAWLGFRCAD